jgi:hypothetical protein
MLRLVRKREASPFSAFFQALPTTLFASFGRKMPHTNLQGTVTALLTQLADGYPARAKDLRLELLKAGFKEAMIEKVLKMKVGKPHAGDLMVPCLANGHLRRASEMLAERLRFAGAIHDIAGHMLSLSEMHALLKKKKFLGIVKAQAENWDGSAPASIPLDRLSVFSVRSMDDGDLTYLVWPISADVEPALWEYAGHSETRYENLAAYLKHLCA